MSAFNPGFQPKIITETEIFRCCFTETGELVVNRGCNLNRQPTLLEQAHLRAAFYWLKQHQPTPQASELERVRGYLEAAYHFSQLEAWESLCQILFVCVDRESYSPLHEQLGVWECYSQQIDLCEPLLERVNPEIDCLCLNNLGFAYTHLCQYQKATHYYQRLLKLATEIGNREALALALGGLGVCYGHWGQYQTAWDYCQQQLLVLDQIDEISSKARSCNFFSSEFSEKAQNDPRDNFTLKERCQTLATLGYLDIHLRCYRHAVRCCREAVEIARQIDASETEWYALGRLAIANTQLGKSKQALEALQQQYQQRHQGRSCSQISAMLVNIALVYCYKRQFEETITCVQELLQINQQNGNASLQCYALLILSFVHMWRNETTLAMERTQQCLKLSQQFGYRHHESQSLSQLSYLYSDLGETFLALDYGKQAFASAQTVDSAFYTGIALAVLGLTYLESGKLKDCLRSLSASFRVLPPWNGGDSKLLLALVVKRLSQFLLKRIAPQLVLTGL
ncbi:tetratricopeptide repeat protein [Oscillatoria sp. FACHB-1406]|uniref:tetratricopeptide repeat protein n=1 Tax=Oscillatoria sp. FACHB-1406 TaxID=2692846 RepID=UPI0016886F38|nr:tetratricopeptide repeat protein [Oscillatoria sp. FACHB-1406]MBD2580517.1 tetratricopeptide repeat protein [Oscillatoria sp. FACHB-1406]